MQALWKLLPGAICVLILSFAGTADAQVTNGVPMGNFPGMGFNPFGTFVPNSGFAPGMNGMSQQQLGNMMGMRMLQGMGGRHGVQTGVSNPILNDGYGSMPQPYFEQPSSGKAANKSSHSKRDEARLQRAENKRLAAAAKSKPKADKAAKVSRKQKSQP